MDEQIILAKFIELKRRQLGLSQAEVAELLEMKRGTYQNREKGEGINLTFLRSFSERVIGVELFDFLSSYESYRRGR
jgi:transcriptional regulator with XRE-family HTH domain